MHPKYLIFIFLAGWSCSKPPEEDVYTSLKRFMAQNKHKTFVIKTQWADFDTVSFAELEQYADKIASLSRVTFDNMRKLDGFPVGWLLQRQRIDEVLVYDVYVGSKKLQFVFNHKRNELKEIWYKHVDRDSTKQSYSFEVVYISYIRNEPQSFHLEVGTSRGSLEIQDHKMYERHEFYKTVDTVSDERQEALDLANRMCDLGMRILAYHKSKTCPPSDFLAEGPLFRGENLEALNASLDSLYQTSDETTQKTFPRPKEAFTIHATVVNHPEKGYLYLSESLYAENLDVPGHPKGIKIQHLLKMHLTQLIEAKLRGNPTPTRYCVPIRYEKRMFFHWENGKVVEVAE